ncbi:MAG: ATP-binding protein [Syntrophobacteraceae bacterium]|nr:adenine nucleotide alpha hydrolase family protein [Desulfobacteraceae bacterium]
MPNHNALFCADCFVHFFHTGVTRAMAKFGVSPDEPLMVAVSGGKDSLAVWNALHETGYATRGLHVRLGIDEFSDASSEAVRRFAEDRRLPWAEYSLEEIFGYSVDAIRWRTRRKICSVCGLLKRQMLNRLTVREGYRTLVVGHNLDDEAGRLLGNMVRHRTQFFEKQYPFLPSSHPRLPSKLKPLYRLDAREIRAYCRVKGILPLEAKCPHSRGATSHAYKEALEMLETRMPGTKRDFLFSYVDRRKPPVLSADIGTCKSCGEPAFGDLCSVCKLSDHLKKQQDELETP